MKISLCKSLFAVQKGFQAIARTLKNIKRLRDGSFLVECGKRAQAQNLLRTNRFIDRPVTVSIHKTLNSSRAVIRCRDLADMSEVEIQDELKDQGVVGVNRVTLKKEGKVIPTNTLFLTFGSPELLKEITVGYLKVKVALFVPNPMCCFNCNKFGHTSQHCKVAVKCMGCGKDKHEGQCEGPKLCSNCSGPHASSAKDCLRRRRRFNVSALRNAYIVHSGWLNLMCILLVDPDRYQPELRLPLGSRGRYRPTPRFCASPLSVLQRQGFSRSPQNGL